ncbi:MAG TPA: PorV/PorQ family protein [bacterium]|nr:PorV/PorQ family protein [bacterium]
MMKRLKAFQLLAGMMAAAAAQAYAQDAGGVVSPFEMGGSARALGMGGVGAAFAGDGGDFLLNPATLATLANQEILTFHSPLLADASYDALGYALPVGGRTSFGLALERVSVSGILQTTDSVSPTGTVSDEQLQGILGYGFELEGGLSLGGSVKYMRQTLGSYQAGGMGADAGVLFQLSRSAKDYAVFGINNISLGLSVSNLVAPEIHLFEGADKPARVLHPAFSYRYQALDQSNSLWLGVEGAILSGQSSQVQAGLEYGWKNTLFARVGFDGVSPTAGAGLRWDGLEFDYAFNQRDLGALQRFSLTYSFNPYHNPLDNQKMNTMKFIAKTYDRENEYDAAIQAWKSEYNQFPDDGEAPEAIRNLEDRRQKAIQGDLREGRDALDSDDMDRAIRALAHGLSLDPTNPSIKKMLGQVNREMVLTSNYMRGTEAYSREDYKTAVRYLGVVYDLQPGYRDTTFLYHDAQSHYLPLESMDKSATDHYALGVNAYMAGKYSQAISEWQKVLEQEPKNYLVRRNIEQARQLMDSQTTPQSDNGNKGTKN